MPHVLNFREARIELDGTCVVVREYQVGARCHCQVESCDPGATIARAVAATAEEARKTAVSMASARLTRYS